MTTKKRDRNLVYCLLFLLLLIGIAFAYAYKNNIDQDRQKDLIIEALQTGIKKSIDKHGRETAEKQMLITTRKQLQNARADDSTAIGILKKLVGKNTTSAAVIKSTTSGTLISKTPTFIPGVKKDSSGVVKEDPCNPTIKDTLQDKWATIAISANKDSTKAEYTVHNEYEVTQDLSEDKQGKWPFRYRSPVMKVKNNNPHTKTDEINAWAVEVPNTKAKVAKGVVIAGVLGFVLGVVLAK